MLVVRYRGMKLHLQALYLPSQEDPSFGRSCSQWQHGSRLLLSMQAQFLGVQEPEPNKKG